jgi:hypothetical protein
VGKNDFDKQKSNIAVRRFGIRVEKHSRRATLQGSACSALSQLLHTVLTRKMKAGNRTTQIKGIKRYMELPPDRWYRD